MAASTYLTTYQAAANATSHTVSTTLASALTGKVVVVVSAESTSGISGVTFDGVSLSADALHDNGTTLKIRTYYLDVSGKAAGTYNAVVTCTASLSVIVSVFTITEVASGAAEGSGTSNASPGTATVTASTNAALIAVTVNSSGSASHTFTGDVTERDDRVIAGAFAAAVADASNVSSGTRSATATYSLGTGALLLLSYAHSVPAPISTPAFGRYGVRGPVR